MFQHCSNFKIFLLALVIFSFTVNAKASCYNEDTCQYGECTAGYICNCYEGYKYNYMTKNCEPYCELDCMNGGQCVSPNTCSCDEGYRNLFEKGPCVAFCKNGCNGGICVKPEKCICDEGKEYRQRVYYRRHGNHFRELEDRCKAHFQHRISSWVLSRV